MPPPTTETTRSALLMFSLCRECRIISIVVSLSSDLCFCLSHAPSVSVRQLRFVHVVALRRRVILSGLLRSVAGCVNLGEFSAVPKNLGGIVDPDEHHNQ